ncbi:hypothetical protein ACS52_00310 [Bacillus cereus]|nr:hypothetical protein ACS52_00310 [Bacillus cereus]
MADTEVRTRDRNAQDRGRLAAAALLRTGGEAKLGDIDPRIIWLDRNDEVECLKAGRQFAAEIDRSFAGGADQPNQDRKCEHAERGL